MMKMAKTTWARWHMHQPAPKRLVQEDHKGQARLSYRERSCLKTTETGKMVQQTGSTTTELNIDILQKS